jgi:hypothetical protein
VLGAADAGQVPVRNRLVSKRSRARLNIDDILIHPTVMCLETVPG